MMEENPKTMINMKRKRIGLHVQADVTMNDNSNAYMNSLLSAFSWLWDCG